MPITEHRSADAHHRAPRDLPRRDAGADAAHHGRRDVAGDDGCAADRSAREEGDDRRDHRRGAGDARVLDQGRGAPTAATSSTSSAPAATARTPSTSRPASCSSPRPAARASASTATAACRASRAAPTCWRRWACRCRCRRQAIARCIADTGIGFMFAPNHHPAMKNVGPVRKELGVRTIFNILGPLTNPADAPNILMGVFHPDLVGIQVRALQRLGAEHAHGRLRPRRHGRGLARRGDDGRRVQDGAIHEYEIHPEDFGLTMASNRACKVETPAQSKALLRVGARQRARPGARHRGAQRRRGAVRGQRGADDRRRRGAGARGARPPARRWPRSTSSSHCAQRLAQAEPMSDILERIVAVKREEIAAARRAARRSVAAARRRGARRPARLRGALRAKIAAGDAAVIAEIKKASPSKGVLRERIRSGRDRGELRGRGAACLSVLTDAQFFQGSRGVPAGAGGLRAAGAAQGFHRRCLSGVRGAGDGRRLHPADRRLPDDAEMADLEAQAPRSAWRCWSRCTTARELERALRLHTPLVGINNRNLRSFEVSLETTLGAAAAGAGGPAARHRVGHPRAAPMWRACARPA